MELMQSYIELIISVIELYIVLKHMQSKTNIRNVEGSLF